MDYFEMLERRAEHPRSLIPSSDEFSYQMQLDAFIKRYGPFASVRQLPDFLNEWAVEATRDDGSVVRGAFMHPLTARRMDDSPP